MSNPLKGDLAFDVDDATYTLRFSIDALCKLEEAAGKTYPVISAEMGDAATLSVRMLRLMLWAGLQEHHKDISLIEVGDLIPKIGDMLAVTKLISKAIGLAFEQQKGPPREANPLKPSRHGTGSAS